MSRAGAIRTAIMALGPTAEHDMGQERTTLDRVIATVADRLGKDSTTITGDTNLCQDLGAHDIDMVEIAMDLEDEFSVDLPDAVIQRCETVAALVEQVTAQLGK
jgi:acyl carrier protein